MSDYEAQDEVNMFILMVRPQDCVIWHPEGPPASKTSINKYEYIICIQKSELEPGLVQSSAELAWYLKCKSGPLIDRA